MHGTASIIVSLVYCRLISMEESSCPSGHVVDALVLLSATARPLSEIPTPTILHPPAPRPWGIGGPGIAR